MAKFNDFADEEFYSVADDVFTLIDKFLVGEYVLADLDYTYCYPLDGNKLYCNKPDPTQPSGKCEGEIDYDAGFNHLYCKKCGAIYKAKELAAKVTKQEIVRKRQGDIKMKIRKERGSEKNAECASNVTPHMEPDNCGNYVAMSPTVDND